MQNKQFLDPSLGLKPVVQKRSDIIEKYTNLSTVFPDVKDKVRSVYSSANNIIVEFTSSGSNLEGAKFELPICSVLTLQDGKIVQDNTYCDND